jgi:predicted Rossmann-fold nucleotide-binding protein
MSAYRLAAIEKFKQVKEIKLSRSKGKSAERKLESSRKKYEKCLAESFPHSYFDRYRITVFGSGLLTDKKSNDYRFIEHLTRKLGKEMQVDIVTGGGGGLMLAANEGLAEAQADLRKANKKVSCRNLGIKVDLSHEMGRNDYLNEEENFLNFSTRLEEFVRTSNGIYLAPGGFGTDLEAAMFVQLKQRWRMEADFPILAHPFWRPIFEHESKIMFNKQIANGRTPLIAEEDLYLIKYTSDLNEIVKIFKENRRQWEEVRKKVKWGK